MQDLQKYRVQGCSFLLIGRYCKVQVKRHFASILLTDFSEGLNYTDHELLIATNLFKNR